jgi:hypothetical protein
MALERAMRRSCRRVPESDGLIEGGRRQHLAVRREGHVVDPGVKPARMALERAEFRSRRRVLESDGLVAGGRRQYLAVRRKSHGLDRF